MARRGWTWKAVAALVWAALWAGAVWPGAWGTTETRVVCPPDGIGLDCHMEHVQTNLLTGETRTLR